MASIRCVHVSKRFEAASQTGHSLLRLPFVRYRAEGGPESGSDDAPPEGSVLALDDVDLEVHDGESMVIIGSSGCGKSTLLRCVAGLDSYAGTIFYGEDDVHDVTPRDRHIGIVFQHYALYPQFEAEGNLAFFFKLRRRDNEITERVRETSAIMGFGFDQLLARKPATLSGGQRQRVAIARAICRDPKLLLFDEPLSNLDAKLRATTRIEIRRLINRFKITTLYVTHDQTEATLMGDRICVMDHGRIMQTGTYRELYDQPGHTFVAGFLGAPAMNLLEGTVADGVVRMDGLTLPLPAYLRADAKVGQALIIGIRPEHISVGPDAVASTPSAHTEVGAGDRVRVSFDVIERLPSDRVQLLYTWLGGKRIAVKAPLDQPIPRGTPVTLRIDPDETHAFDPITGKRI